MTEQEFYRIASFLKSRYGIDMSRKKEIVQGRLENYIRLGGWKTYTEYMNAVEQDVTGKLEKKLVSLLSTNHTYFMREFEHFDYLRSTVLPYLKQTERRSKDIRIWCGASSTGEEPYMIAMLLMDFFGLEHKEWDTKVLATDISTEVLKSAIEGVYTQEQIEVLPDNWKRRYVKLMPDGEHYRMTEEIKNEVLFRKFNLMEPFPFRHRIHVIF